MRSLHGSHARAADDARTDQLRTGTAEEAELAATLRTRGDPPEVGAFEEPPTLERWDRVQSRWNLGSVLVLLAGAALAVIGGVALARTGVNETWFRPVHEVAGIRHTPLLAAIEAGVGLLLVAAGLAGAPGLAAFICISAAMAAGVAAVEPGLVAEQLATERWWLVAVAVAGAGLAVIAMVPWPRFVERHYTSGVATAGQRRSRPRPGLVG